MSTLASSARVIKVSLRETSSSFKSSPSIHVSIKGRRNADSKTRKHRQNMYNFGKLKSVSPMDSRNIINDFAHKKIISRKKKIYSLICIFGVILIVLFLCIAIAAILVGLLIKKSPTTVGPTIASGNPCTSGVYWNVTGSIYAGTSTGIPGNGLNELNLPSSLYFDSNDNLYIGDAANRRVMKYTPNATSGVPVVSTGTSGTGLNQFSSSGMRYIYVDSSENIYVSDYTNNRVVRWANGSSTGVLVAGDGTSGGLLSQTRSPAGVWVDSNSNVYVAEYGNERVTKWIPGATTGSIVAGNTSHSGASTDQLSAPAGLHFDEANQDLYIVNAFGNGATVMKWRIGSFHGTVVGGVSGFPGFNSTQLLNPMGVTVDQWKNVYVTDLSGAYVKLFCNGVREGIIIAGSSTGGTSISSPYDVKLDSQMNLYVALRTGYRVMKFNKL